MPVVVMVSCVDDLAAHVGLRQVLALLGQDCTPIFCLPSTRAAEVFRLEARRAGWEMLVHILSEGECLVALGGWDGGLPAIWIEIGATFDRDQLKRLRNKLERGPPWTADKKDQAPDRFYFGDAGGLPACLTGRRRARPSILGEKLSALLGLDLDALDRTVAALRPAIWDFGGPRADRAAKPLVVCSERGEAPIPPADDRCATLTVMLTSGPLGRECVVRQSSGLLPSSRPLVVRLPHGSLTCAPQMAIVGRSSDPGAGPGIAVEIHTPPSRLGPSMLTSFLNRGGGGNAVMRAFASGVGCYMSYAEDEPRVLRSVPVVWGILRDSDRIIHQAKEQGLYFYYVDHAYFDRGHGRSYRITRNRYEAGAVRRCPSDRIAAMKVDLSPWRTGGGEIVVCPPTEAFARVHHLEGWLDDTLATLRLASDRPFVVRRKPKAGEASVPLLEQLSSAHALVTHSSNVAVEAACFGVPVFVSSTSAAAPVGLTDLGRIERPAYPDREAWLAHLAYNQFSLQEIADGSAWRMLVELEERGLA